MSGTFFLVLAGLVAFGFLILVWRRRQMPALLRAILIVAAAAIVVYVACVLGLMLKSGPVLPK